MGNVDGDSSSTANSFLTKKILEGDGILNNIFNEMDWQTICICRQVSKRWYDISLRVWREMAPPLTLSVNDTKMNRALNELPVTLDDFEGKYRWNGVNEYKNITLQNIIVDTGWICTFPFLSERRNFIRKLSMQNCVFVNPHEMMDIVLCTCLPNLKSLKFTSSTFGFNRLKKMIQQNNPKNRVDQVRVVESITSFDVQYCADSKEWPFCWTTMLAHYPNLKVFRVAQYSEAELKLIMKAIEEVENTDNSKLRLASIDIGDRGCGKRLCFPLPLYEYIQTNADCFRAIKSLSFCVTRNVNLAFFEIILKCMAEKLRFLKVSGSTSGKNRSLKLPATLPNLASLILSQFHLKNLNFLNKTPNLRKLYIFETRKFPHSHNIISNTTLVNNVKWPLLSTFACNQVVHYEPEDICCLKNWMPNLSRLKLHLNDSSFFAICIYFPKIKMLHICNNKVGDYGFTGYRRYNRKSKDFADDDDHVQLYNHKSDIVVERASNTTTTTSEDEIPKEDELDDSSANEEVYDLSKTEDSFDKGKCKSYCTKQLQKLVRRFHEGRDLSVSSEDDCNSDSSDDSNNSASALSAAENMYREKVQIHHYEMHPIRCEFNATYLKDLEVLVLETCDEEYGRSGVISTATFLNSFRSLDKLKEVWVDDGVITKHGIRVAIEAGLYRNYSACSFYRPLFID